MINEHVGGWCLGLGSDTLLQVKTGMSIVWKLGTNVVFNVKHDVYHQITTIYSFFSTKSTFS